MPGDDIYFCLIKWKCECAYVDISLTLKYWNKLGWWGKKSDWKQMAQNFEFIKYLDQQKSTLFFSRAKLFFLRISSNFYY